MDASETFLRLDPDKRERVVAVAAEEFAQHGFAGASVNRIVDRLGIAKGSLFKYFGTKEGLFRFVFGQAVGVFKARLKKVRAASEDQDFFARLRQSLEEGVRFIADHPVVYRIYLKMLFQENFPLREMLLEQVRLYSADYLTPLVEQGKARGDLRPEVDTAAAVFVLDALMDRFLQAHAVRFMDAGLGLYGADGAHVQACMDRLLDVARAGLAAPRNPQSQGMDHV
ncbi:MAG: TetR/AcrR family transcriptional regulator [Desulfovibrionaceae bacterium]